MCLPLDARLAVSTQPSFPHLSRITSRLGERPRLPVRVPIPRESTYCTACTHAHIHTFPEKKEGERTRERRRGTRILRPSSLLRSSSAAPTLLTSYPPTALTFPVRHPSHPRGNTTHPPQGGRPAAGGEGTCREDSGAVRETMRCVVRSWYVRLCMYICMYRRMYVRA